MATKENNPIDQSKTKHQKHQRRRKPNVVNRVTKNENSNQQRRQGQQHDCGNNASTGRRVKERRKFVDATGNSGTEINDQQHVYGHSCINGATNAQSLKGAEYGRDDDNDVNARDKATGEEMIAEDDSLELYQESFERASADLEMVCAAYPEEITIFQTSSVSNSSNPESAPISNDDGVCLPSWFPFIFTLTLPPLSNTANGLSATITMELPKGYPTRATLQVVSYRGLPPSSSAATKEYVEAAVDAVRLAAAEAMDPYGSYSGVSSASSADIEGEECALACCAAAIESWRESSDRIERALSDTSGGDGISPSARGIDGTITRSSVNNQDDGVDIQWVTSNNTLVDRKSVFQAHVCPIDSEMAVRTAVNRLISGSGKIQRATHNMYAYRFTDTLPSGRTIIKHDNDDDGEDGAGSRLAQLLEMRKEDGVLVLVSRWYGGTHLGPKRFAHIVNVARDLLEECHAGGGCLSDD